MSVVYQIKLILIEIASRMIKWLCSFPLPQIWLQIPDGGIKSFIKKVTSTRLSLLQDRCNGTIHPGLRLLPSGFFFLALNRSHQFLLKSQNLRRQLEHNDSTLIILHCWKYWEYIAKLSSLNHCPQLALLNSDFF